jgi:Zn-dependent protease
MIQASDFGLLFAIYLAFTLFIGMSAREYARAWMTNLQGDHTPRLWGRLTLDPRAWFDPFGSGILPALILILWASAAYLPVPFAYGKPAPIDPYALRGRKGVILASVAGPVANTAIAVIAGLALRSHPGSGLRVPLAALMFGNLTLAIYHLLPIPGLDGARIVALYLPERAAAVYRGLDQYLVLFVLVLTFIFASPIVDIVFGLSNVLCRAASGVGCFA